MAYPNRVIQPNAISINTHHTCRTTMKMIEKRDADGINHMRSMKYPNDDLQNTCNKNEFHIKLSNDILIKIYLSILPSIKLFGSVNDR